MIKFQNEKLDKIRILLEAEKTDLSNRIDELLKQDPFTNPDRLMDNAASDMEASEESNHDRVSAVIDELKGNIEQINAALTRIGDGTYGTCANCGAHIGEDRLQIVPMATLCLECESKKKN